MNGQPRAATTACGDGYGTRIAIFGGPGAGKSTLAKALGAALALPVIQLDGLRMKPGWQFASGDELRERLDAALAREPAWVFDGDAREFHSYILERADAAIWLRLPWRISAWRLLRRGVHASLHPLDAGGGNRTGPLTLLFTLRLLVQDARCRTACERDRREALRRRPPGVPVLVLRTPAEVEAFRRSLPSQSSRCRAAGDACGDTP